MKSRDEVLFAGWLLLTFASLMRRFPVGDHFRQDATAIGVGKS